MSLYDRMRWKYVSRSVFSGNAALKMTPMERPTRERRFRPGKAKAESREEASSEAKPRRSWKTAPKAVAAILVVAAVVVMILVSYAQLVMVNDDVVSLRSELNQLQAEETKLMSQYELAYDLQEIEEQMLASGQMTKIQNWQTYTLELSEPDSVEYYQAWDGKEKLMSLAKNLITAVKEYF